MGVNNQNQKSVCFITGQLGLGGAERQLYLLSKGLVELGWRVSIITLNPDDHDYWAEPLSSLGIEIFYISSRPNPVFRLISIYKVVSKVKPHILQSWTLYANLYAVFAGLFARVPVRLGAERSDPKMTMKRVGHIWYKLCLLGIDGCLANSENACRQLRNLRPGLIVYYLKNGVDAQVQNIKLRDSFREKYNIPKTKVVIGTLGSLFPYKNVTFLIEVFSIVIQESKETFLVIGGGGYLLPYLEEKASSLLVRGNYRFLGKIENASSFMNMLDIFGLPSLCEGMPNVVMEASAAGLPVVASNVGAVPELVDHQETGYIIQPDDLIGMSQAFLSLISDPQKRARMGMSGRQKMISEFSVSMMVKSVVNIYEGFYVS